MTSKDYFEEIDKVNEEIKSLEVKREELKNQLNNHLLEINGYKIGDVVTDHKGNKCAVDGVDQLVYKTLYYLGCVKLKKDGTVSRMTGAYLEHKLDLD